MNVSERKPHSMGEAFSNLEATIRYAYAEGPARSAALDDLRTIEAHCCDVTRISEENDRLKQERLGWQNDVIRLGRLNEKLSEGTHDVGL